MTRYKSRHNFQYSTIQYILQLFWYICYLHMKYYTECYTNRQKTHFCSPRSMLLLKNGKRYQNNFHTLNDTFHHTYYQYNLSCTCLSCYTHLGCNSHCRFDHICHHSNLSDTSYICHSVRNNTGYIYRRYIIHNHISTPTNL